MIKLVDARRGLYEKCVELFRDEKVAERIYMYLCDGIEECDAVALERKKGEWIDITKTGGDFVWKCSKCGELNLEDTYFCPNCGADMRRGQDEQCHS